MTGGRCPAGGTAGGEALDRGRSVTETVAVLARLVGPSSVVDVGSHDAAWLGAFRSLGVDDVLLVRPPLHPGLPAADAPSLAHDLRLPLHLERRFDLAVAIGTGEYLQAESAEVLVRSLCDAADVVAFSSVLPGLAPPGTVNSRWPSWWDSLFAECGLVPHDAARPMLWDDGCVDLTVRQGLVLYAPDGRLATSPLHAGAQRSVVHPEAYTAALAQLDGRRRAEMALASERALAIEGEWLRLAEENHRLTEELEAERAQEPDEHELEAVRATAVHELEAVRAMAEHERAAGVLARAGQASAERALAQGPSPEQLLAAVRSGPVAAMLRSLTTAVPVRRRLRRLVGPSAPLWEEAWYVSQSPDVLGAALSPLWHYRRHGARLRRSPHPWFDPNWYIAHNPAIIAEGHDPVEHYLRTGWRQGCDPHPLFATTWYGEKHASAGYWRRSPLEHWLERGRQEGLSPHPLLDARWYLAANADVRQTGHHAVEHFLRAGWHEGCDPHPLFDVRWYLDRNPDVAREGVNPLVHYLWFGWREGRDPHPLFATGAYLDASPDVRRSGAEPLAHYVTAGAFEGRSTGPFDTAWYVARHPEAADGGRNPLVFFLEIGRERGDDPSPPV